MDSFDINSLDTPSQKFDPAAFTHMLGRTTVLRPLLLTTPIVAFLELCTALEADDTSLAASQYHVMTSALLERDTRRVTGDIWKDFLFSELFETPNRFSRLAAELAMDPPIMLGMKSDLRILQRLFELSSTSIMEWITRTRHSAKRPQPSPPDKISRMAASAWSGGKTREKPKSGLIPALQPSEEQQPLAPVELAAWSYEDPAEHTSYAADEGLAVLYRRFLASDDWSELAQPLCDFHMQYGCGTFLRYRIFTAGEDGLFGMSAANAPEWDSLIDFDSQKERLYANTLRFLHTGHGDDVLLCGADGMGKTSLVLSLTQELPELRLVFMAARSLESTLAAIRLLHSQPLRFIVFLDDLALNELEYRRLKTLLSPTDSNVLLYASAINLPLDSSLFSLQIKFEMPDFDTFCACVRNILRREHVNIASYSIEDACAAWQDRSDDFSIRAARRLAQQLIRTQTQYEE